MEPHATLSAQRNLPLTPRCVCPGDHPTARAWSVRKENEGQDFWDRYCGELNHELVTYFRSLRPQYQTAILSNGVPGARRVERDGQWVLYPAGGLQGVLLKDALQNAPTDL